MLSKVDSCPPCRLAVEVKTPAGLPAKAPENHSADVPSMKYLSAAAMLPNRVGLPMTRPPHSTRSWFLAHGGPEAGTSGAGGCRPAVTAGTVRILAAAPSTSSMPRATIRAICAVWP